MATLILGSGKTKGRMAMDRLKGRIIIVTGAGSGIGRAAAYCFCREGAQVVVADVNEQGGQETVSKIKEGGGDAIFVKCDVSKAQEVKNVVDQCVETFGGLNCAFNNAGIEGIQALTADYSEEMWDKAIHVNLIGVYLCMKYEIPAILKSGGGSIVNMSSILGLVGFAGASAYVAAKHGVVGLTKTAAIEYATKGIRVNAVCPAFIMTPMLERGGITKDPATLKYISELHPMKRLGKPEEVAESVIWLFTDAASFVTGTTLMVDGGYLAQ